MTPVPWLVGEAGVQTAGWGTMAAIFGGIAAFMLLLRFLGLYLASTHPVPPPVPAGFEEEPALPPGPDPKVMAIIAATVSEVLGQPHRIVSVRKPPSVESLMQHWSMEGRRAIYSSHKFR